MPRRTSRTRFRGPWLLAVALGSVTGLSGAAYGLLNNQAQRARALIGRPKGEPLNADGLYLPDGRGPVLANPRSPHHTGRQVLTFAVFGDSSAAGVGADTAAELPGVLLAQGLAEELGRPVRLVTHAVSGSRTADLPAQVNRALQDPPDVGLIMIGGNDVTSRTRVDVSARLLGAEVDRLRAAGVALLVGTCPDLGTITPIAQPLRSVARRWSFALAAAQQRELDRLRVAWVSMGDLLMPEFVARPELFSADRFHPSGAGYAAAANLLLAPLCAVAGVRNQAQAA